MFWVYSSSPLDEQWQERDQELFQAAGRASDQGAASYCSKRQGHRYHSWLVETFEQAMELRQRLEMVAGTLTGLRER